MTFFLKINLKELENIVFIIHWWNTVDNNASIVYDNVLWQWNVAFTEKDFWTVMFVSFQVTVVHCKLP